MGNFSEFCTCKNFNCSLHPTKHDRGCTPCINKNLKLKEIPNCFFNLVKDSEPREGDSLEEFAKIVLKDHK
ncbi:MAG: DUF6485 family protein [Solirubrobacterales bacterium]